ncbi:MAG: lytic transglycosylase domain-containing protein [Clostridiales bacterium]|nr:lytic transglycosylase domain-containing protein [Clostridiales bacterium]
MLLFYTKEEIMTNINRMSNIKPVEYDIKNAKVKKSNNEVFSSYMEESKSLDEIFEQASRKYNVPLNLLKAIGKAESNFNPDAVSRSGAQGVMQLMPATAAELGVTDSFDPEQNIMGGSKYISDLLKRYDGDTKLALAAYNAGMGNVKKYGGIPPFKETQNYVVKVIKYMEEDFTAGTVKTTGVRQSDSLWQSSSNLVRTAPNWHTPPAFPEGKISLDGLSDMLDILFSYQDYMKFMDIFLASQGEK